MKHHIIKCLWILVFFGVLSACKKEATKPLQGYIDADYTYISSSFSGNLIKLNVARGNIINKGDLLFELDAQPEESQLNKAKANVAQAMAQIQIQKTQLEYQKVLLQRYKKLIRSGGISQEELDTTQNNYNNAKISLIAQEASMQSSMAELTKTEWMRSNKKIYSPISGYVYDTYFTIGELVPETRPVLSLVASENLKVVFYIFEPLLATLQLKQTVNISYNGYNKTIPATISYISSKSEYTPPYIFSENTRTKFVYRIEAKPIQTALLHLHPGQPVSVHLPD